jgi:dienelactone hydrolase
MRRTVRYSDGPEALEGYLVSPALTSEFPGVLIVPTWLNITESIRHRADRLAQLGYAAFVVDILGTAIHPKVSKTPLETIKPFLDDRRFFRQRLYAGLEAFYHQPECSRANIAAIGYCLGGCGVLELARSGANLLGVVSLHGLLDSPLPAQPGAIKSKILILHGDEDAVASISSVMKFREEMREAQANWEINIYGGARHGFTGEGVVDENTPAAGLHSQSEVKSWQATIEFLRDVFVKVGNS